MELSDYIRILRKNWIVIVAVTLLAIGAAAVFSLTRTPMYQSSSDIMVSTQSGSSSAELTQGNTYTQARVNSWVQLASSPKVLDPVVHELGLTETAAQLADDVSVSSPTNTTVLTTTVTNADAGLAADIANSVADSLSTAIDEVETLPDAPSPVKVTLISAALPATAPASPNVPLNLALGALIGLALGVAFAVLRTVLDTRVRSTRDIEALTERPIIGAIPHDPKAKERPIILRADPQNPRSEAFRALRTNLQFLDIEGGHSFVITSSMPSEGKSTTAVNLAIALADAGKRVILIDGDLRKPKIAEYLGIEGGAGLTDVLIGRAGLNDVMQKWGSRSLYVLPAGKIPPNPSELLGSARMSELLEGLAREADTIIIDAPPILPVTDAAVLARSTSGAIVVAAAGSTHRNQLSSALEALETVSAHVAGIVLSMVPTRGPDAYGYGYGYGYRYVADEAEDAPMGDDATMRSNRRAAARSRRSA